MSSHHAAAATALLLVASSFNFVSAAHAACNSIPSRDSIAGKQEAPAVLRDAGLLPYRGALGRIDRAEIYLSDGTEAEPPAFTVGPDGCGGGELATKAGSAEHSLSVDDLVVTLVFESDAEDGKPHVLQMAAPSQHKALEGLATTGRKTRDIAAAELISNDGVRLYTARTADCSEPRLRVSVPTPKEARLPAEGAGIGMRHSRVVVTGLTNSGALSPSELASENCSDLAKLQSGKPLVCIDTIYDDYLGDCVVSEAAKSPFACQLTSSGPSRNSFQEKCFEKKGSSLPPNEPPGKCRGKDDPGSLHFAVDACGNLRFPYRWSGVVRNPKNKRFKREVLGSSGISRTTDPADDAIRIPGRVFLASTLETNGDTTPYKPTIEPDKSIESDELLAIDGVADKDISTVWILPRVPVHYMCPNTNLEEACTGVVDEAIGCVDSAGKPSQHCDDIPSLAYYACGSGPYKNQPCTNSSHCGGAADDKCDARAVCVPWGSVWDPNETPSGSESCDECTVDEQCGYSLFELRSAPGQLANATIPYKIEADDQARGVCEDRVDDKDIPCGSGYNACPANAGACIGYRLEAGGVK